jgi:hypothetical protein
MFSIYDLAEVGACFASFFVMLFVLVRKPGHASAHLFVIVALCTCAMWVAFIVFIPRVEPPLLWQAGLLTGLLAIASAFWLLFLQVFARESTSGVFRGRSLTLYLLLILLAVAAVGGFVTPYFHLDTDDSKVRFFHITPIGKYLIVLLILSFTLGLLQLESTFRASVGQLRRALVLPVVALGSFLSVLLVAGMMDLLYSRVDFAGIQLSALLSILVMVLVSRFLVFEEIKGQRVVISREAVYSSVAVLLVGAYFLLIGGAVWLLVSLGGSPQVFFSVLAAFVLTVVFVALFLSSSIRQRWRGLVDRSFYSGRLDLLTELSNFAEDVTAATDRGEMFAAMVTILEQKCRMTGIAIVLKGNCAGEFVTAYPASLARSHHLPEIEDWLFRAGKMISVAEIDADSTVLSPAKTEFLGQEAGRQLIPLIARKELVGFVGCRSSGVVDPEVRFLIDSISHQLALSLLSARQSEILLETRELASFTKVSSFVIHDMKNLISMLSMILQNAQNKFGDPRFQQMTMETLGGALERMRRLINRLSSPAKQIDFELSDCNLRQLLLDLIDEMKLSSQRKIAVKIDIGELPLVRGNMEKLKSVTSNLIINAIEAMPTGGELRLSSAVVEGDVCLTVQDTGVGMTAEFMREKLFRPFQTSKAGGLGIGLFQSKELAEQMGGRLSVKSAPGEGSTFELRLKLA